MAWSYRLRAIGFGALALGCGYGALETSGNLRLALAVLVPLLAYFAASAWRVAGRWAAGAASERTVARRLRSLERQGWLVLHAVDKRHGGDIDHLAAGPGGVFAIETKTARFDEGHLEQARRSATWAQRKLGCPVTPVLCLARLKTRPYDKAGVLVCGSSEIVGLLERQPGPPADLKRVARRLRGH